jgi:hypothetical protein
MTQIATKQVIQPMQSMIDQPTQTVIDWAVSEGASSEFVLVLTVESNHLAFSKARKAADAGASGEEFRARSGHFLTALWEGETNQAFRRADLSNRRVMASVDLVPESATADAFVP